MRPVTRTPASQPLTPPCRVNNENSALSFSALVFCLVLPDETGDAAGAAAEVLGSTEGAEEDGWQVSSRLV